MEELSLVIHSPEHGAFLKRIDWNRDEFKELISSIAERYTGLVFGEDQVKEAKEERARLNAMRKAISDRRIQIKNEVMAPYTAFEDEVKEIVALIDKPINEIDTQVKAYEERRKDEKKEDLLRHFQQQAAGLEDLLTFEMVFDKRYLNTTVSVAHAKQEISDKVERIRLDLKNIETLEPEYRLLVKNAYLKTLDLSKAIGEMYRLKKLKALEAAQAAAEKPRESETAEMPAPNVPKPHETVQSFQAADSQPTKNSVHDVPPAQDPFSNQPKPKQYKASFIIYGSMEEIMAVRQFMIDRKIRFGKVEQQ